MVTAGKEKGSKKQEEEFDVKELYTPLSVAKKEIWRRWNDKGLRKRVKAYLGGSFPDPFKKEPRAVLSRSIITPNFEFFQFFDLAKKSKLKPVGFEGIEDKFCTKNADKVSLGKLSFLNKSRVKNKIKNIECRKNVARIIDMPASDGKKLCDIKTLWGENLVDFHHRMLDSYGLEMEKFDDFKWLDSKNRKHSINEYYLNFFTFFLCFGILFENFITKGNENGFTKDIAVKNFKKVEKIFGIKPLVVQLLPMKYDDSWYFRSYDKNKI